MKIVSLSSEEKLQIVSSVSHLLNSGLCIHCLSCLCFAVKICIHTSTGLLLPGDYTGTKSTLSGYSEECIYLSSKKSLRHRQIQSSLFLHNAFFLVSNFEFNHPFEIQGKISQNPHTKTSQYPAKQRHVFQYFFAAVPT